MIQHIMQWNYKDDVTSDQRAHIEEQLAALPGKIPAMLGLKYGPVVGGRSQSFSHCFVMLFADADGLAEYAGHPAHLDFSGPFKEACAAQVATDFREVDR